MNFEEVLDLSPKRFWFLSNQIIRIGAEERMLQMHILAAVGSEKGFESASEGLEQQIGQVYVWKEETPAEIRVDLDTGLDPEFDREALRALAARMSPAK